MKAAVFNLNDEDKVWIKKSAKAFKMNDSEFMRTLLAFNRETDISELKARMQKTSLESRLVVIRKQEEEARRTREQIEKQLEAVSA